MSYVIVPQRWQHASTFFTQVKRIDNPGMNIVKVFECRHHHYSLEEAGACPEALAARDVDQVAWQQRRESRRG